MCCHVFIIFSLIIIVIGIVCNIQLICFCMFHLIFNIKTFELVFVLPLPTVSVVTFVDCNPPLCACALGLAGDLFHELSNEANTGTGRHCQNGDNIFATY